MCVWLFTSTARTLREYQVVDEHVFELERLVLEILARHNLNPPLSVSESASVFVSEAEGVTVTTTSHTLEFTASTEESRTESSEKSSAGEQHLQTARLL